MPLIKRLKTIVDSHAVSGRVDANTGPSSALYRCSKCETTFIAVEMDTCPKCETDVTEVPSATDLGFEPE